MKRLHLLTFAAFALFSIASYGQTSISPLPYYINSPGTYVVATDLSVGGIAILINSANVTLDFNGHILTCTNPLGSIGVVVNQVRNVRIKNGTLTGFLFGIVFNNPSQIAANNSGHFVEEMHITQFPRIGIEADNATGCVIQNNYVNAGNNFSAIGIEVSGAATGNLLESGNLVLRNQVLNCNAGIVSAGQITNNYFESNVVYGCIHGFELGNDKCRFNTTVDCVTPFRGGILLTDQNN